LPDDRADATRGEGVMPKEIVRDQADRYDVRIGWDRERGCVQVGVETSNREPLVRRLTGDAVGTEGSPAFTGVWGTLNCAGVNHLIRVLRRARDQAFGRDE